MTMLLVAGNQSFEVEPLTDVAPDWPGIKVMTTSSDLDLGSQLQQGTEVSLQGDGAAAGSYEVGYLLSPAAPRHWRIFLKSKDAGSGSAPGIGAKAPVSTDAPNQDKLFTIKVSGLMGGGVRRSVQEYKVPFSRLSQEVSRITKTGAQIISITESVTLTSLE